MARNDARADDQLRPFSIELNYLRAAEGSALVHLGSTRVLCAATVEERVPPFLKGRGTGWVTAEYALLPRSTTERTPRESVKGRLGGRTHEIQRIIGRSLRSVVDLNALGERSILLDCDVLEADGGTRTAAITGAFVALVIALTTLRKDNKLRGWPLLDWLAATSAGIVDGRPMLDLTYEEDARAIVDMNVAMTADGRLVEIQGTGEGAPFTRSDFEKLLALAASGIASLVAYQQAALEALGVPAFGKVLKSAAR